MNLIEQLGGYENAKIRLQRDNVLNDEDYKYGQKVLLDYRRQHNIFEIGDKVVFKDGSHALDRCDLGSGEVLVIKDIDFYDYLIFECSPHGHGQKWFKHATDEEIKAGKRLEVTK